MDGTEAVIRQGVAYETLIYPHCRTHHLGRVGDLIVDIHKWHQYGGLPPFNDVGRREKRYQVWAVIGVVDQYGDIPLGVITSHPVRAGDIQIIFPADRIVVGGIY